MQKILDNSSLQMDFVVSFENFENGKLRIGSNDWGSKNAVYIELMEGNDSVCFLNGQINHGILPDTYPIILWYVT